MSASGGVPALTTTLTTRSRTITRMSRVMGSAFLHSTRAARSFTAAESSLGQAFSRTLTRMTNQFHVHLADAPKLTFDGPTDEFSFYENGVLRVYNGEMVSYFAPGYWTKVVQKVARVDPPGVS